MRRGVGEDTGRAHTVVLKLVAVLGGGGLWKCLWTRFVTGARVITGRDGGEGPGLLSDLQDREGQGRLQRSCHTQNANSVPIEKQTFKRTRLGKCSIKTSQNFLGRVQRASKNTGAVTVGEAWSLLFSVFGL